MCLSHLACIAKQIGFHFREHSEADFIEYCSPEERGDPTLSGVEDDGDKSLRVELVEQFHGGEQQLVNRRYAWSM